MQFAEQTNSEGAILTRVIQPDDDSLPSSAARALLKFGFTEEDQERMHDLAGKNQRGSLTSRERHELDSYVRVGRLLDLLVAKALLSLKKHCRSN